MYVNFEFAALLPSPYSRVKKCAKFKTNIHLVSLDSFLYYLSSNDAVNFLLEFMKKTTNSLYNVHLEKNHEHLFMCHNRHFVITFIYILPFFFRGDKRKKHRENNGQETQFYVCHTVMNGQCNTRNYFLREKNRGNEDKREAIQFVKSRTGKLCLSC